MDLSIIDQLKKFVQILKSDPQVIHLPELEFFRDYLESLGARLPAPAAAEVESEDPDRWTEESEPLPASPALSKTELTDAEMDKANQLKQLAQEAIEAGDREKALDFLNQTIALGGVSAMLMTKRAELLLKLKRPLSAIKDCDIALTLNPDSGKAFRIRGMANRHLQRWEKAHSDLAAAQRIDFDDATEEVHKLVDKKFEEMKKTKTRSPSPPRRSNPSAPQTSFPIPGGMGNMFADLMADPELASAMTNPRVMQALQEMMSNPAALLQYQADPEVGPVLMKLMSKFGGMPTM